MSLDPGSRLGPYEIVSAIGAGGMGEVYRATDTSLGRQVAIKVLPETFATDPDRLARFEREAKTLASLNHPNIAQIYGLERSGTTPALVLELVEGETLGDRIARGPIPIDEALPMAKQIAEALEAAHEQGIIHRDLKPANIKVRPDGTVKVLDFGLAKLTDASTTAATGPSALSLSPTITSPAMMMTSVGVLLGTAAYMAPEQARGKPADKRSDIWAFGCVLYEVLTGTRAFKGDDVADTLAAVLRGEPDWNRLPKTTPPAIRRVLRRCLAKERTRRLSAMDAVRLEIEEPVGDDVAPSPRYRLPLYQRASVWAPLACIAVIAAVASWVTRPSPPPPPSLTFQIPAPPDTTFANGPFSLSPDGSAVAFIASGPDSMPRIWIRPLASLEARALPGTENAGIISASGGNVRVLPLVWSPDSRALAFGQQSRLRKIELATGALQTLCDSCGEPSSWGGDGIILVSGPYANGSIQRVAASGGSVTPVAVPNRSGSRVSQYQFPSFLPDGKHFVFLRTMSDSWTMFVGSIDNPPDRQETLMLREVTGQTPIVYVRDQTGQRGHLLFMQDDMLVAQPLDTDTLTFTGEPVPVLENVGRAGGGTAFFTASSNGMLAFRNGSADRVFVWYATDGKRLRSLDAIQPYTRAEVQLSPDGSQLITTGPFPSLSSWVIDVNRGLRTRIAPDGVNAHAVWSRDGGRIAYSAPSGGKWALSLKSSSGATTEKIVWQTDTEVVPNDWSSDGRYLLYASYDAKTKWDLWALAVDGEQPPLAVARTASTEVRGQFSPDHRWIAYESDASGERQIYVKPFVTNGSADDRQWTIDAGAQVRWSRDGKRLFYRRSDAIFSVDVTSGDFRTGDAKTLFSVYGPGPGDSQNSYYDVSQDGEQFLVTSFPEQNLTAPITVLLNWRTLLER